jgi:pyridoxamine 5'-phosphate oxidase
MRILQPMKFTLRQLLGLAWNMKEGLHEREVDPNPIVQFRTWYDDAVRAKIMMPDAMALATVTPEGAPAARMVLLKSVDDRGFTFYTNYDSRKAEELDRSQTAALLFHWVQFQRQVRISGSVSKISAQESDEYFRTRPRESQISAHASPQSRVVANRGELDREYKRYEELFRGKAVPRPERWGGYRLKPKTLEFWKGRIGRLHDRILYELQQNGDWKITRLAP